MDEFHFGSASDEERQALRDDPARCVALLSACQELAAQMAHSGLGIYSPLDARDEALLQGFHRVQDAHAGQVGACEGAFEQLCSQAGLRHSDVGLLDGRLHRLYQEFHPVAYEAEVHLAVRALLHRSRRGGEQTDGA
jgi:hypothetical protein